MLMAKSSLLVYNFLQHAYIFCSTWMTSCMQYRKRGQSSGTDILVRGWIIKVRVRRKKKKGQTKFCSIGNSFFSVCSFAHLLCLHIVFEQNYVFPFFFSFSFTLSLSIPSPKYQSQLTNPLFFYIAYMTSSRQSKKAMHAVNFDHNCTTQNFRSTIWGR